MKLFLALIFCLSLSLEAQVKDTLKTGAIQFGDSSRTKIMWTKSTVISRVDGSKGQPALYDDVFDSALSPLTVRGMRLWNRSSLKLMTSFRVQGDGGIVMSGRRSTDTTQAIHDVAHFYNDSTVFYVNGGERLRLGASYTTHTQNFVLQDNVNGFIGVSPTLSFRDFLGDGANMFFDGGGLRVTRPLILPGIADIPGLPGGSMWWSTVGDTMKIKTRSGTILKFKFTGASDQQVLGFNAGTGLWQPITQTGGGGGGSLKWSGLLAPDASLNLNHGGNSTIFTYSGLVDAGMRLIDNTTLIAPPFALMDIQVGGSSALFPFQVTAFGNGIKVDATGQLTTVASGNINATKYNGNSQVAIADLNSAVAVETEANEFTLDQRLRSGKAVIFNDTSNVIAMAIRNSSILGYTSFYYDWLGGSQAEVARIAGDGLHANAFDKISGSGMRFADHIFPNTTNARDIGSASLGWKDLYLTGTIKSGVWNGTAIGAPYVSNDISTQKVEVASAGTLAGTRKTINFIGASVVDNAGSNRVDVTITGSNQMTKKQILDTLSHTPTDTLTNNWTVIGSISSPNTSVLNAEHFGWGATAANHTTSLGFGALGTATYSVVIGDGTAATGAGASSYSTIVGCSSSTSGNNSTLLGGGSTIQGNEGVDIGWGATILANQVTLAGATSQSQKARSVGFGYGNFINSLDGGAFGANNTVAQDSSFAIGHNISTTAKHQYMIGGVNDTLIASHVRFADATVYATAKLNAAGDSVDYVIAGFDSTLGWVGGATYTDPRRTQLPISTPQLVKHMGFIRIYANYDWLIDQVEVSFEYRMRK